MIEVLLSLIIVLLICGIVWWIITLIPFPPGFPIWVIQVLVAVVVLLFLVSYLLPMAGLRLR